MSIISQIESIINTEVKSFIEQVSEKFSISSDELFELWKSDLSVHTPVKLPPKPKAKSDSKPKSSEPKETCVYTSKKGKSAGEVCGSKVCDESQTRKFCKRHIKEEQAPEKPEKQVPKPQKKSSDEILTKDELKKKVEERVGKIEICKNKFGNYEHFSTHIVFDRNTSEAYGKQSDDGKIIPLTIEDIETCKSFNFRFKVPENLVNKVSKDDLYVGTPFSTEVGCSGKHLLYTSLIKYSASPDSIIN